MRGGYHLYAERVNVKARVGAYSAGHLWLYDSLLRITGPNGRGLRVLGGQTAAGNVTIVGSGEYGVEARSRSSGARSAGVSAAPASDPTGGTACGPGACAG